MSAYLVLMISGLVGETSGRAESICAENEAAKTSEQHEIAVLES